MRRRGGKNVDRYNEKPTAPATINARTQILSSMVSLVGSSEVPSFGRLIGRRGGVRKAQRARGSKGFLDVGNAAGARSRLLGPGRAPIKRQAGLNASSQGELDSFEASIGAYQDAGVAPYRKQSRGGAVRGIPRSAESRMREIRTFGLTSGEGKRGDWQSLKPPRPSSTLQPRLVLVRATGGFCH